MGAPPTRSAAVTVTASNGAIHSIRPVALPRGLEPADEHDSRFPYHIVQRAGAPSTSRQRPLRGEHDDETEDEYGRKVRTISRALGHILTGRALRPNAPPYTLQLVSHRVLRYSTGILHIGLLASNVVLVTRARFYRRFLALQLVGLSLAGAGKARLPIPGARLAYYYYVVTKATVAALVRYLRSGTPQMWDKAKGTR